MKILAVDQSTRVSGYAIFDDGELVDFGRVSMEDESYVKRFVDLRDWLDKMVSAQEPAVVALEDIQLQSSVGSNVLTYKRLAGVQAVLMEYLERNEIPYHIISSNSWKSTCGVKGRTRPEQKKNAQAHVLEKYGAKCTQDEADAICIGEHLLTILGNAPKEEEFFDWS